MIAEIWPVENVKKNWGKMVRKLSDSGGLSMCPGMCPFGLGRATFVSWQVGVSLCVCGLHVQGPKRRDTLEKAFSSFLFTPRALIFAQSTSTTTDGPV